MTINLKNLSSNNKDKLIAHLLGELFNEQDTDHITFDEFIKTILDDLIYYYN